MNEQCDQCPRVFTPWVVADYIWTKVCPEGGVYCFTCFTSKAEAHYPSAIWEVQVR